MNAAVLAVSMAIAAVGQIGPSPAPIVLSWTAPGECPGADQFKAEVRRMSGVQATPLDAMEAHATVQRLPEGTWQLTLTTKVGTLVGQRQMRASDCAELERAAALVVALMISPGSDRPETVSRAAPIPPRVETSPPAAPPPSLARRRFVAGVELVGGADELPGVAAGAGATLAVGPGALTAEVRADVWLPQSASSPAKPSAGGTFAAAEAGLAGCLGARRDRRLAPRGCLGVMVTRTHATAFGVSNPSEATVLSGSALLEGSLGVKISTRNVIRAGVGALTPFERPTFALAGVGTIFRTGALWLRGTLGWELNF